MKYSLLLVALMLLVSASLAMAATSAIPLDSRTAATAECSFGNLLADALRAAVGGEIALVNASEVRSILLPAGAINAAQATSALVYPGERVVLAEISGSKLRAALERSVSILPQPSHGFLQVSGLTFNFRSSAPAGARVQQITIGGRPLEASRIYRVALPETLAKGAQGYSRVFNGLPVRQANGTIVQALLDYLQANQALDLRPGSRIRDLG